ncbi:hypothetical protein [Dokdonella soli]|uniref:DUF305 domain-containing protein n=1 Tax=Dokdonella soli TaxID=529810 RepID=A0ABP3TTF7_9GAMM
MKTTTMACAIALGLAMTVAASGTLYAADQPQTAPPATAPAAAATAAPKLHVALRELWQGHIQHTRAYAMAVRAGNATAAKKAADDVVANAKQIADAVGRFYGADAGAAMLKLLAGHWGGVKAMTDADHAGDKAASAKAMQDLTANADAIAKFLSGANPNLPEAAVRGLVMTHVGHHSAQIGEIMKGDMQAEATTWKAMQAHMNTFADALADGIAKQFPAKAT